MTEQSGSTPYEAAFGPNEYEKWVEVFASSTPFAPAVLEIFEEVTDKNRREIDYLEFHNPSHKIIRISGGVKDSDESSVILETDGSRINLDYCVGLQKVSLSVKASGDIVVSGGGPREMGRF